MVLVMVLVVMVVWYVFTRVALHVHGDPLVMHRLSFLSVHLQQKRKKLFVKIFLATVLISIVNQLLSCATSLSFWFNLNLKRL
jgi:hypothetical protein